MKGLLIRPLPNFKISESDQRMTANNTYKLELAEVDKVDNGNVTLGSVNLGFRKRDELPNMSAAAHSGIVVFRLHTLSRLMVGR